MGEAKEAMKLVACEALSVGDGSGAFHLLQRREGDEREADVPVAVGELVFEGDDGGSSQTLGSNGCLLGEGERAIGMGLHEH